MDLKWQGQISREKKVYENGTQISRLSKEQNSDGNKRDGEYRRKMAKEWE